MIYIGKSYSAAVYELPDITLYIIRLTTSMGPGPLNVALIAKPNRELRRVLLCLKSRNHDVLLIDPPRCCPPLFSVESLLEHARLLDGATPRFKALLPDYMYLDDIDEEFLDIKEDLSKTVDFTGKTHSQIVLDFLSVILFKNDYKWYLFNLSLSLYLLHGSERIPTVRGDRTAVFWDAEDYPFPLCFTPDEIYHSIASALVERGS